MASSSPATPVSQRSFSLPTAKHISSPNPQIEVLFNLPSARIVSFTTGAPTSRPGSSSGNPPEDDGAGTLPWVSRFERTIAVGPLRIYRAPGSVAFLNCAGALRPILPKSQAWCVDGDSKFVLQVRRPQYWRIEVPNKTGEERMQVEELKSVFGQVLLFEKTPCPFERDFTVELPAAPTTPIKKKPWRPVEKASLGGRISPADKAIEDDYFIYRKARRNSPASSPLRGLSPSTYERRHSTSYSEESSSPTLEFDAQAQTLDLESGPLLSIYSKSEDGMHPQQLEHFPDAVKDLEPSVASSFAGFSGFGDDIENASDVTGDLEATPKALLGLDLPKVSRETAKHEKPQAIQNCSRSITAPPVLSLITSPPSKQRKQSPLRCSTSVESSSDFSSSVESFHSVQSWHSPLAPPSPPASRPSSPTEIYPYPHNKIILPKRPAHTRDVSELTITPDADRVCGPASTHGIETVSRGSTPPPKTPVLENDSSEKSDEEQFEVVTPPTVRHGLRHRATTSSNSRRRQLSPLPAAINLFSPPRRNSRRLQTARHLPIAIIQKTCAILLSPPSHLLHMMLNIASKIAAGEWRGFLSGHGDAVHWDFEDEYGGDAWFEDDYGLSLSDTKTKAKKTNPTASSGSWEVD